MTEPGKLRVMVVDDDLEMVAFLEDLLRKAGFEVDGVPNAARMREAMARNRYALMLLDLRLKSEDGLTVAREVRQSSTIPIIMISGSSDETDRVLLLELAADDFLIKPFSPRELLARVRAVLRRTAERSAAPAFAETPATKATPRDCLQFGQWVLDPQKRELMRQDGTPCALSHAEFRLLEAFVRGPHRVWTRDQLLEQTRGMEAEVFDRTIDVLILRLRRKIEPNPKQPQYICTERGLGYMFAADVTRT